MTHPATELVCMIAAQLRHYYQGYINRYCLETEDIVADALMKLLEGDCSTVNSACSTTVRSHVRYRRRNLLFDDLPDHDQMLLSCREEHDSERISDTDSET